MTADNIRRIKEDIAQAAIRSGRGENSVRLMAVSKMHSASAVLEAARAGQLLFGENRVQEALPKFSEVRTEIPQAELHIIGSLQRNKVRQALSASDCVQSLDRISLADEIERVLSGGDRHLAVFIEVRTGEETKSGFTDEDAVYCALDHIGESCPHLDVRGFMTMAPLTDDTNEIRQAFKKLASLAHRARARFSEWALDELSMGMSNDYHIAIEEGSTLVRIGRAIFGERHES